ncbi:MAG: hypothetical protein QM765_09615 [Myxococcales bacterium]
MPNYCPVCRTEYRDGIAKCAHCEQALVPALPEQDEGKGERLRSAVKDGTAAAILRMSYTDACQMIEFLQAQGMDAMITGDPKSCGKGGQCSHFFVAVLPEDVELAAQVLKAEQKRLVESDEECQGANLDAMVDFDAEGQKKCPACGASFEGTPEECPDCGLFIGATGS